MTAQDRLTTQDCFAPQGRLTIGASLARLRFPDQRGSIDLLLRRDENFRDMCEELAELDSGDCICRYGSAG